MVLCGSRRKKMSDKKPTLGRLSWLLERMNASHHPITDEQVERFGRHPGGPILPSECLEVKRFVGETCALSLSPDGKPYLITHDLERSECLLTDGTFIRPLDFDPNTYMLSFLGYVTSFGFGRGQINPSISERIPLILARSLNFPKKSRIFLGHNPVHEGPAPALMLADGRFVYLHFDTPRIEDRQICPGNIRHKHLTALSTGEIAMIHEVDPFDIELNIYSPAESKFLDLGNNRTSAKVNDLVEIEPGLLAILDGRKGYGDVEISDIWSKDEGLNPVSSPRPYLVRYLSDATRIDHSRFAHVGETARDKLVCWYADNKPGPGFNFVSSLFKRDGKWCYYAVLGRHLFTIALHKANES